MIWTGLAAVNSACHEYQLPAIPKIGSSVNTI